MNPGPFLAILFFCILPAAGLTLAFIAGTRYARYGWAGVLPKLSRKDIPDGPRILSTRQ
jgi:hypothetical protein